MATVPSLLKSTIKWATHRDTNIVSPVNSKPSWPSLEDNSIGVIFVVLAIVSNGYDDIVPTKIIAEIWEHGDIAAKKSICRCLPY